MARLLNFFKIKPAKSHSLAPTALKDSAEKSLQAGELDKAVQLYNQLIEFDKKSSEGYYKRGNALSRLGKLHEALADYDMAVSLEPTFANAYCNRGSVLQRLDRLGDALESYDRAVGINPIDHLALYNRGSVLKALARYDEALDSYDRCIILRSDYWPAYLNRGHILQEQKKFQEAAVSFGKVITLEPANAEAFQCRGFSLAQLRRFEEALESYDRALVLNPAYSDSFQGRVYSLVSLGRYKDAIEVYDRAILLNPKQKYLSGLRLHARMQICDWEGLELQVAALTDSILAESAVSPPFPMLSAVDSPKILRIASELWVREQCPPDDRLGPLSARLGSHKIRIGYFSPDFRDHAVSQAIAEMLELHDRSRFEVFGFAIGPRAKDAMRARLERTFDRFIDVGELDDTKAVLGARELGLDIAVDLGGYTEFCRSKLFALRVAPIQVNYLGFPSTMGAPYMDYMIGDRVVVPLDQLSSYCEKIAFLPGSYLPHDSHAEIASTKYTRTELGLPEGGFIYCCFNKKYKLTPTIFDSWMRILGRVPESVLWLSFDKGGAVDNLRREASRRGIDPKRLIFAQRVESYSDHLARLRSADLFLDTTPYNAHATATDALWAGLPVLTLKGLTFASRVSASLLTTLGILELIAENTADYEDRAVSMAQGTQNIESIRQRLSQNRLTKPLFDTGSFTRYLEEAYTAMHRAKLAGTLPENIFVNER